MRENRKGDSAVTDPPPRIPDFRLLFPCGKGGTGEVWAARDLDGIRRAVRLVPRNGTGSDLADGERDARGIAFFRRRAPIHENVAEIFHHGRTGSFDYYVSALADNAGNGKEEYIPDTLAERLKRRGKWSPEEILSVMLPLVSAVEYLHFRGIAHSDLKPENILFVGGVLKITDHGLADECNTVFLPRCGTPEYVPDYPCCGRKRDLYAAGKILYCLYSGNPASDFPEIGEEPDMESIRPFNEIALKCCSRAPSGYTDAHELKKALLALRKKSKE
ncbi:MAG: protein kinase [Lentisphaeria bacterium]|nr:protein kinase [Lentisphaeria bacterium]